MTAFVIADTHFGHRGILDHCPGRPGEDITEHDEILIAEWNSAVKVGDIVYHLGDFSFHKRAEAKVILDRLNGSKILIPGNHDTVKHHKVMGWSAVLEPLADLKLLGRRFTLCHYPMMTWNQSHKGAIHLHGHSHGNIPQSSTRFDVGVDGISTWMPDWVGFRPVELERITALVDEAGIEYVPVDHHKPYR